VARQIRYRRIPHPPVVHNGHDIFSKHDELEAKSSLEEARAEAAVELGRRAGAILFTNAAVSLV
jgi:hypothetical protein